MVRLLLGFLPVLLGTACLGPRTSQPSGSTAQVAAGTDSLTPPYIPRDLEDAFAELDRLLSLEDRRSFAADSGMVIEAHFGLGMGLRNRWGLWGNSRLARYFNGLGVCHPDDMSGIVLRSYWRRLNNRPLDVPAQIAAYRAHWRAQGAPESCAPGRAGFQRYASA